MTLLNKLRTLLFYFKPRKIVAQYKLYTGDEWLEVSIDSIAPYVYKILLVVSDVSWGGHDSVEATDLEPVIGRLKKKYGQKIIVLRGSWDNQFNHVDAGLTYIKKNLPEATHCFYLDSDEIYTQAEMAKLMAALVSFKYFNKALMCRMITYFKDVHYKIEPDVPYTPLMCFPIRSYTEYNTPRSVTCRKVVIDIYFHHVSYVRKDEKSIENKFVTHAGDERLIPNWYEDVWKKWTPELRDFHPDPMTKDHFHSIRVLKDEEIPPAILAEYNSWIT
jgi:hypothetical protein